MALPLYCFACTATQGHPLLAQRLISLFVKTSAQPQSIAFSPQRHSAASILQINICRVVCSFAGLISKPRSIGYNLQSDVALSNGRRKSEVNLCPDNEVRWQRDQLHMPPARCLGCHGRQPMHHPSFPVHSAPCPCNQLPARRSACNVSLVGFDDSSSAIENLPHHRVPTVWSLEATLWLVRREPCCSSCPRRSNLATSPTLRLDDQHEAAKPKIE
ncbi:hypothetical protein IWX49DRAFT_91379 [Phyllosticta citricarpa]